MHDAEPGILLRLGYVNWPRALSPRHTESNLVPTADELTKILKERTLCRVLDSPQGAGQGCRPKSDQHCLATRLYENSRIEQGIPVRRHHSEARERPILNGQP